MQLQLLNYEINIIECPNKTWTKDNENNNMDCLPRLLIAKHEQDKLLTAIS